jgi:hypothetical protein
MNGTLRPLQDAGDGSARFSGPASVPEKTTRYNAQKYGKGHTKRPEWDIEH